MKKKAVISIIVIILVGILVTVGILKSHGSTNSGGIKVTTNKIEKGTISTTVTADGVVESSKTQDIILDSGVKVTKIYVEENQKVSKGDKLLEIEKSSVSYSPMGGSNETKTKEKITAPVDGIVTGITVKEGWVASGMDAAMTVVNNSDLKVRAKIKEVDISNVEVGQKVTITGDALGKDQKVEGKVLSISPMAKVDKTSTSQDTIIEAIISINKNNLQIKPGYTVSCDIIAKQKKDALMVSYNMLREDKDGNKYVFVADTTNKIMKERKIKLGVTSGLDAEVVEGLKEGERVILDPQPNYKDGVKIDIDQEK